MAFPTTAEYFAELVAEALAELPAYFRDNLANVEILVEPWADRRTISQMGVHDPRQLLGCYHGIPRTKRTSGYNLTLPDKISLYQQSIELRVHTQQELRDLISHVLRHEIAHHFGIDDEHLRQIGAY
ncbi:MAG: metallopeptidase family protein [Chloroflexota bacterium]|nr:metallopeptidase family protein [Chloroflexota bacterium]